MRKIFNILIMAVLFLPVFSCTKENTADSFKLNTNALSFTIDGGQKLLWVRTNSSWTLNNPSSWVLPDVTSGKGEGMVSVSVSANKAEYRTTVLEFVCDGKKYSVSVNQSGKSGPAPTGDGYLDPRDALGSVLSDNVIFSKGAILVKEKNIMQGFDFTDENHIYYSQSPSSKTQYVSYATGPNVSTTGSMSLDRFGHMTQIVAEANADGKTYIWCNSLGQNTSDGYGENMAFSRVEYKNGASYTAGYAGDTFVLGKKHANGNPFYDLQVSVDFVYRRLLVGARVAGVSARFHWIYDLDQVLALPLKTFTFSLAYGGNGISDDGAARTENVTLQARDLNDATQLGYFEVRRGSNTETDVYSYSHQGHEVHGSYVWFYEGNAVANGNEQYYSVAYVTVFDYAGNIVVPRTSVKALSDNVALNTFGFTKIGYAEPESIKVKGDMLYLGLGCHNGSGTQRKAQILKYQCKMK